MMVRKQGEKGSFLFFTEPFKILPTKFSRHKSCFETNSKFYSRSEGHKISSVSQIV